MLQPVTTSPVAVSSAAPTLNPEKRARACARASTAAATSAASSKLPAAASSSAIGCQAASLRRSPARRSPARRSRGAAVPVGAPLSTRRRSAPLRRSAGAPVLLRADRRSSPCRQSPAMMPSSSAAKAPAHLLRHLHHLRVIERLRQHAGGRVGDARDAEHLDAHVPRDDRFRHGRHADGVGADRRAETGSRRASRSSVRAPRRRRRGRSAAPASRATVSASPRSRFE